VRRNTATGPQLAHEGDQVEFGVGLIF
jgi:hypothetical protein